MLFRLREKMPCRLSGVPLCQKALGFIVFCWEDTHIHKSPLHPHIRPPPFPLPEPKPCPPFSNLGGFFHVSVGFSVSQVIFGPYEPRLESCESPKPRTHTNPSNTSSNTYSEYLFEPYESRPQLQQSLLSYRDIDPSEHSKTVQVRECPI
jgi:hypothetical protein